MGSAGHAPIAPHAFDLNQDKTPVCKEKVFSTAAFSIFCHLSPAPFFLANED
jgi:hypothetical protein